MCYSITFILLVQEFVIKNLLARKKTVNIGKGELKIAAIIIYFIVSGVMGLSLITAASKSYTREYTEYFICESTGRSSECILNIPPLNTVVTIYFLFSSLLPVIALLVNCDPHAVKTKFQNISSKFSK